MISSSIFYTQIHKDLFKIYLFTYYYNTYYYATLYEL